MIQALLRWTTDYQRGCWPTKGIQPNPATDLVLCSGENPHPVSAGDGSATGDLTLKTHSYLIGWRRCQHWRFHRSQRLTDSRWGGTSTHHPTSTQLGNSFGRMDLGCFLLAVFCYFTIFVLFLICFSFFELILLWSCICRGLTLNLSQARICEILLSVQAFSEMVLFAFCGRFIVRALLQQGIPRDRRNV